MKPLQPTLERLLYVALLFIFIGVGIGIFVLADFGSKLDHQLQSLQQIQKGQADQVQQLKTSVAELKANNERNTEYLRCLLALHASGIVGETESCDVPAGITTQGTNVAQLPSPKNATTPQVETPVAPPKPTPTPTPAPAPQQLPTTAVQEVIKLVNGILDGVLK